jgi:1-pyrroline-5-carboxylate dehydrogenase
MSILGYFIEPTVVVTTNPHHELMREEVFGPVLAILVYDHKNLQEALNLCNSSAAFGLTGSIFARDRAAIAMIHQGRIYCCAKFF